MEQLITSKDLAKKLQVTTQCIFNWRTKKGLPFTKIGKSVRFFESEVNEWLKTKGE